MPHFENERPRKLSTVQTILPQLAAAREAFEYSRLLLPNLSRHRPPQVLAPLLETLSTPSIVICSHALLTLFLHILYARLTLEVVIAAYTTAAFGKQASWIENSFVDCVAVISPLVVLVTRGIVLSPVSEETR